MVRSGIDRLDVGVTYHGFRGSAVSVVSVSGIGSDREGGSPARFGSGKQELVYVYAFL